MAATMEQEMEVSIILEMDAITDDMALIQGITWEEDLNNGKNLTDKLGEENENDLSKYAEAIREALSPKNDSFVTIMNRNSIFANPRAVVIDAPNGSTPEESADAQRKTNISLRYAAGYRNDIQNSLRSDKDKLTDRCNSDWRIFFKSLFPEGADLSQYQKDKSVMENHFKNIAPNFVTSRYPENMVYVYMLTMEYPLGSGKKPTLDQILTDDSAEMRGLKEKAGEEFCKIFQKLPPDRTVDGIQYENDAQYYDKCAAYNSVIEDARVKIIRDERNGPTQRTMNIEQAQISRNGGMAAQGTALTQTQPAVQRQAQQNGPSVQ